MFLNQVDKAVDIIEEKYAHAQALSMFDNAQSHRKCPDNAFNANHMNVNPAASYAGHHLEWYCAEDGFA